MAQAIKELSDLLARLPGVGKRTAQRLTFHLLKAPAEYTRHLGSAIASIGEKIHPCSLCRNLSDEDPCAICSDRKRDPHTICVVESVPDLWAVEETAGYRGQYHVLHGLLSPLDGVGPEELHVETLARRVADEPVEEVIIATRPSVEGEATAVLISQILAGTEVKVTRIASGIPHGGELEYTDRFTLGRAISDRREMG